MQKTNFYEKNYQKNLYNELIQLYKNSKYNTFEREATKYLDKFPNDVKIRFMRAKVYRKNNKFDKAISDLKYNLNLGYNSHSVTELYYLYYFLNMYEEALELLPIIYKEDSISNYSVSISEHIMRTQLGQKMIYKKGSHTDYITKQIYNYNEEFALGHIQKHLEPVSETKKSVFNTDINLKKLFDVVRKNLNNSKKVNCEEILEIHYFSLANAGYLDNDACNFIKVVVIPNTNKIISMYPTNHVDTEFISNLECDYEELFNRKQEKVKTKSRIDIFNQRYKRV